MLNRDKPIEFVPSQLYIEPTSVCNLKCKMCYTNVINGPDKRVIPADRIMSMIERFVDAAPPPYKIYWCGTGEIFLHKEFPQMVNEVMRRYGNSIAQTVQTNGTIDRLDEFDTLKPLKFSVSVDGQRAAHDWHRGEKNYDRTLAFCRSVLDRGGQKLTLRLLLTRDNIHTLHDLQAELVERLGPRFVLEPMLPFTNKDLNNVRPKSLVVVQKDIDDSRTLTAAEARAILEEKYQGRYQLDEHAPAVTNYLSLTTYGVFSCCNAIVKLGEVDTDIATLKERLLYSQSECRACSLFPCM